MKKQTRLQAGNMNPHGVRQVCNMGGCAVRRDNKKGNVTKAEKKEGKKIQSSLALIKKA